ncbi:hypothetical protein GWI33_008176 [Rhynchophorus ferrugineus]|uniref:Uncharacterized protein n=1 Tax=Rhynchophorus ferrugineus TaxID=354439 RepID=A0A834MBA3_RHYFE|nr:hypothetical protein GWI33_008176 [Rhynchophorus ferrugineus]
MARLLERADTNNIFSDSDRAARLILCRADIDSGKSSRSTKSDMKWVDLDAPDSRPFPKTTSKAEKENGGDLKQDCAKSTTQTNAPTGDINSHSKSFQYTYPLNLYGCQVQRAASGTETQTSGAAGKQFGFD